MYREILFGATCAGILMAAGLMPTPTSKQIAEISEEIGLSEAPAVLAEIGKTMMELPEIVQRPESKVAQTDNAPNAAIATETTEGESATGTGTRISLAKRAPAMPKAEPLALNAPVESVARSVNFETDTAVLDAEAKENLNMLANWLDANPKARIGIFGHTDLTGDENYNVVLGQNRADTVAGYLLERGVSSDRIRIVMSLGETEPMIETEASSRLNRRVQVEAIQNL